LIEVKGAEEVTDELIEAIARLVPQLSTRAAQPSRAELEQIVRSPATTLLVAHDGASVVGTLTLVLFRIPTGLRARIEDVVVDSRARNRGVGEALTREAVRLAEVAGARTIELSSHQSRDAANRLYLRLGFKPHETNVYRYTIA
jgi:ribosomal protein S18 acetylase RimI-like enzyme